MPRRLVFAGIAALLILVLSGALFLTTRSSAPSDALPDGAITDVTSPPDPDGAACNDDGACEFVAEDFAPCAAGDEACPNGPAQPCPEEGGEVWCGGDVETEPFDLATSDDPTMQLIDNANPVTEFEADAIPDPELGTEPTEEPAERVVDRGVGVDQIAFRLRRTGGVDLVQRM